MKVLFDGQIFAEQRAGGVSRYYTTLAERLDAEPSVSARIVAPLHRNDILSASTTARVLGVGLSDRRGVARFCRLALKVASPVLDRFVSGDLVHETFFSPKPYLTAKRRITTMYDMITELYYPGIETTEYKKASLARCDHVICISHHTKKDLCEIFGFPPERASVTHLAYQDFSGFAGSAAPAGMSGAPYFFYVGNRSVYKNFETLVKAFASAPRLSENFRIVCYGGGPFTNAERSEAAALGLKPHALIHLTGDDKMLGAGYANATAFVYPSLYEGFGIPPLEAMSAGCPVISSNTSSLPEVVGDAALSFDPRNGEALRDALERIAQSSELRGDLVQRGHAQRKLFSWGALCRANARYLSACFVSRRLTQNVLKDRPDAAFVVIDRQWRAPPSKEPAAVAYLRLIRRRPNFRAAIGTFGNHMAPSGCFSVLHLSGVCRAVHEAGCSGHQIRRNLGRHRISHQCRAVGRRNSHGSSNASARDSMAKNSASPNRDGSSAMAGCVASRCP